jgi:hypothetical protein
MMRDQASAWRTGKYALAEPAPPLPPAASVSSITSAAAEGQRRKEEAWQQMLADQRNAWRKQW